MITITVIVFCVLLVALAFLFPRLSRGLERGGQKALGKGSQGAHKAPGKLGRWLAKPFHSASKAVRKSGSAGRRGRSKAPF